MFLERKKTETAIMTAGTTIIIVGKMRSEKTASMYNWLEQTNYAGGWWQLQWWTDWPTMIFSENQHIRKKIAWQKTSTLTQRSPTAICGIGFVQL